MTIHPGRPIAAVTITLMLLASTAEAAGSRASATRAAKRHVVGYVKRYGITLRSADLDVQCSLVGRSRWKCFVYAKGGQCTGTLTEAYSRNRRTYRAREIDIGCGE